MLWRLAVAPARLHTNWLSTGMCTAIDNFHRKWFASPFAIRKIANMGSENWPM